MAQILYTVLRYIPDQIRFEPRNIGVVVLDIKENKVVLKILDSQLLSFEKHPEHKSVVLTALDGVEDICRRSTLDEKSLRSLCDQIHGLIDATSPRFYETNSTVDDEAGLLFEHLVEN